MYYVYVLKQKDSVHYYVGYTSNLLKRLKQHQENLTISTRSRQWQLVYYFACHNQLVAMKFERYLKTGSGRAFTIKHFDN